MATQVEVSVQPPPVYTRDESFFRAKSAFKPILKFQQTAVDKPFNLLSLPPEIRLLIYSHLFANPTVLTWRGTYASSRSLRHLIAVRFCSRISTKNITGILLTCRTTNREATSLFYRTNLFHISTLAYGLPCILQNQNIRSNLRHLIIGNTSAVKRTSLVDAEIGSVHREIAQLCPALETFEVQFPDRVERIMPMRRYSFSATFRSMPLTIKILVLVLVGQGIITFTVLGSIPNGAGTMV